MTQQTGRDEERAAEQREQREQSPAVDHWFALLEAQFGERLDDAGRARIREQLGRMAAGGAELSAHALANGEEPDFIFSPRREG